MNYLEFKKYAEKELKKYVSECVDAGSITEDEFESMYFEEHINNENYLKNTDRIEVGFIGNEDTKYSVYYSTLEVIDTSC